MKTFSVFLLLPLIGSSTVARTDEVKSDIARVKKELSKPSVWTPRVKCAFECQIENSALGRIQISSLIAKTGNSAVWNAIMVSGKRKISAPTESLVIKYSNDCFARRATKEVPEHPLVHEYAILHALRHSGLVPLTHIISGPSSLPEKAACSLVLSERLENAAEYNECAKLGTQVRYMVQQKVGPHVELYFHYLASLPSSVDSDLHFIRSAIVVAKKSLNLIERLHAHGIIHGDLHGGNIAFADVNTDFTKIDVENSKLVLIDFALAAFYPDEIGTNSNLPPEPELRNWFLSPWQLLNLRKGRRDDVIRIIDAVANWFSQGRMEATFDSLAKNRSHTDRRRLAAEIKMLLHFFRPSVLLQNEALSNFKSLPATLRGHIEYFLEQLRIGVLLHHQHPDSEVDYDALDSHFDRVLNLLNTCVKPSGDSSPNITPAP